MNAPSTDFENFYQQSYYRHSGFAAEGGESVRERDDNGLRYGLRFAALALVIFVVPAVAAALVI